MSPHSEDLSPSSKLPLTPLGMPSLLTKSNRGAVLLVDDESAILDLLARAAEIAGYRSFRASNAEEALEIFRRHHDEIALILTDVHMPGMDGFTFLRAAREIVPEVNVIISSGSLDDAEQRVTSDLRASFLPKPYTSNQLVSCIRSVASAGA